MTIDEIAAARARLLPVDEADRHDPGWLFGAILEAYTNWAYPDGAQDLRMALAEIERLQAIIAAQPAAIGLQVSLEMHVIRAFNSD
jgi:hypothetical protein